uniref:Uncharacterized protein n=1 Tax=Rhizophora mucronata TaxID=61149 RepID=A0A2P2ITU8_RHIMU
MAARFTDPRDACAAIAGESYKLWLEHENRTDDITIIIVHIKDFSHSGAGATERNTVDARNQPSSTTEKGISDISTTPASETYHSIRSGLSEMQVSMNRSPAIVVPSPSHHRSLELDGG